MLSWLRRRRKVAAATAGAAAAGPVTETAAMAAGAPAVTAAPGTVAVPAEPAGPAAAAGTIQGIDISSYQGPPASWRGAAGHYQWAAVKLTELEPGGFRYVNPDAVADWKYLGAQRKGRLAYLFGHPSVSAAATVDFFIAELHGLGFRAGDGVALDLEVTDGLGPAAVSIWAQHVMAGLAARLNRSPVLYTYLDFALAGNTAGLGGYPLWIADPSSPAGRPRVPAPWHHWSLHQYDISGSIDRDVANYPTLAAMAQALGQKPQEPLMQNLGGTITGDVAAVRWSSGIIVVAGLSTDGYVQIRRYHPKEGYWGQWRNVSLTPAAGAPGLLAWGQNDGNLYYTIASGEVIELATRDAGWTWT